MLLRNDTHLDLTHERGISGVVKRLQHAGDILKWRAFDSACGQGAQGFTFKIDDHEIFSCIKNLSQMIIAVAANTHGGNFPTQEQTVKIVEVRLAIDEGQGFRSKLLGKEGKTLTQ